MTTPTHITVSGGLITAHFIEAMRAPAFGHPGAKPESFGLPGKPAPRTPAELEGQIAAAFELLVEQWDGIHAEIGRMDAPTLRRRWLRPLFDVLDFDPVYQRADTVLNPGNGDELRFDFTYRGWEPDGPILHSVAPAQRLDAKPAGRERGPKGKPPHDMLQLFLNLSRTDRWAILTNGLALRLLRDYHHTSTRGYVEFDLEGIFESRNLADFRALYRMCHASRFLANERTGESANQRIGESADEDAGSADLPVSPSTSLPISPVTILETFHQDSQAAGVKVGEDLRGQVRAAIETLANGFLQGPLAAELARRPDRVPDFYDEILHVIYRILFLLYAEQRAILPRRDAPLADLYREAYSLTALREHAAAGAAADALGDPYGDLWEGLRATFTMVAHGAPALGVTAYNGMLFDPGRTPILNGLLTHPHSPAALSDEERTPGIEPSGDLSMQQEDRLKPRLQVPSAQEADRLKPQLQAPDSSVHISNSALLLAIRYLTTVTREGSLQRISFADLGVEEVGSVYESLLDYRPRISQAAEVVEGRPVAPGQFFLDPRGMQRKTSGSYYTHPRPVYELVKSALIPVLEARLHAALDGRPRTADDGRKTKDETAGRPSSVVRLAYTDLTPDERERLEAALLDIKVCDSAMGSGHFLIAANNALALELARIRAGDEFPPEAAVMAARRDVLAHCIYGVDLNPMAVELAKVSLWINAAVPDQPLNFLDHHLKCGNSLIGAPLHEDLRGLGDLEGLGQFIPTEAFREKTGDDPAYAALIRKRNSRELEQWRNKAIQLPIFRLTIFEPGGAVYEVYHQVEALASAQPNLARERYAAYLTDADTQRERLIADAWTAAFFWPLTPDAPEPPTQATFARLRDEGPSALTDAQRAMVAALATEHRFFHWHLEFPGVFDEGQTTDDRRPMTTDDGLPSPVAGRPSESGFTVLLGNPPWERIKLQEKEFFGGRSEPASQQAAVAATADARRKAIAALQAGAPAVWAEYRAALRRAECESHFLRASGRYPLGGVGDVNTYAVFAELDRALLAPDGRAGIIVPTGIATDFTYREFFADLMRRGDLASLYDFENRRGIFPAVDSRMKFCLLTLRHTAGHDAQAPADFAFFLHDPDDLADPDRHFALTAADLALINPNTRTCPVFRARRDAELTRKLYTVSVALINEIVESNPWSVVFLAPFDVSNDSSRFRRAEALTREGFRLKGNAFTDGKTLFMPIYEGKMIQMYDHRAASVKINEQNLLRTGQPEPASPEDYLNPNYLPIPQFWIREDELVKMFPAGQNRAWFISIKKVTSPTNERTFICALLPRVGCVYSLNSFMTQANSTLLSCCLYSNLNAFCLDYVARQKLGGVNMAHFIIYQLPVIPPDRYTPALLDAIVPRVVELTYTAWDLLPFARDIAAEAGAATWNRWFPGNPMVEGGDPAPFIWQEARRAQLRAELDAIYSHLYGLTAEELAYILDTFPIVRRKDEARWGEYRTKRLVMEAFEHGF